MVELEYRSPHCGRCRANCCGGIPNVHPILMPWEPFPDHLVEQRGLLRFLQTEPNGLCLFFSGGRCGIYGQRPFECRIYPLLLQFEEWGADDFRPLRPYLKLDPRATCYQESCAAGSSFDIALRYPFPADWAREFNAVSGSTA